MITAIWDQLTVALDELDAVRSQIRESRAQDRGSRFYHLLRRSIGVSDKLTHVADVIELSGGWAVVHWPHDPTSIGLYRSILSLRLALCADGVFILSLTETSERIRGLTETGPRSRFRLTDTEKRIVLFVGQGMSNKEICHTMKLAESTVKNKMGIIFKRVGVLDRTQLALRARDLNLLVEPEPTPE